MCLTWRHQWKRLALLKVFQYSGKVIENWSGGVTSIYTDLKMWALDKVGSLIYYVIMKCPNQGDNEWISVPSFIILGVTPSPHFMTLNAEWLGRAALLSVPSHCFGIWLLTSDADCVIKTKPAGRTLYIFWTSFRLHLCHFEPCQWLKKLLHGQQSNYLWRIEKPGRVGIYNL